MLAYIYRASKIKLNIIVTDKGKGKRERGVNKEQAEGILTTRLNSNQASKT